MYSSNILKKYFLEKNAETYIYTLRLFSKNR